MKWCHFKFKTLALVWLSFTRNEQAMKQVQRINADSIIFYWTQSHQVSLSFGLVCLLTSNATILVLITGVSSLESPVSVSGHAHFFVWKMAYEESLLQANILLLSRLPFVLLHPCWGKGAGHKVSITEFCTCLYWLRSALCTFEGWYFGGHRFYGGQKIRLSHLLCV